MAKRCGFSVTGFAPVTNTGPPCHVPICGENSNVDHVDVVWQCLVKSAINSVPIQTDEALLVTVTGFASVTNTEPSCNAQICGPA